MITLASVSDTVPMESCLTCGDCGPKQKSRKPPPVTFSLLATVHYISALSLTCRGAWINSPKPVITSDIQ